MRGSASQWFPVRFFGTRSADGLALERRARDGALVLALPTRKPANVKMVKQKNHTARNNTVKAHKNGIKKPKNHRYHSTRGVSARCFPCTLE